MQQIIQKCFLLFTFISLCSCMAHTQTIKGNKNITTTTRLQNSSFSAIDASAIGNITLEQGNVSAVTVETEENIQEHIITVIKENTLCIYTKGGIQTHKCNVKITCPDIHKFIAKSCGNINSSGILSFPDITIHAKSIGNMTLQLQTDHLNIDINSIGNCSLEGKAKNAEIKLESMNTLQAFNCVIDVLNIHVSSFNSMHINVLKELYIQASSAASIQLKGKPAIKKLKLESTASFKQLDQ